MFILFSHSLILAFLLLFGSKDRAKVKSSGHWCMCVCVDAMSLFYSRSEDWRRHVSIEHSLSIER